MSIAKLAGCPYIHDYGPTGDQVTHFYTVCFAKQFFQKLNHDVLGCF